MTFDSRLKANLSSGHLPSDAYLLAKKGITAQSEQSMQEKMQNLLERLQEISKCKEIIKGKGIVFAESTTSSREARMATDLLMPAHQVLSYIETIEREHRAMKDGLILISQEWQYGKCNGDGPCDKDCKCYVNRAKDILSHITLLP